jgi:hypothetical protein
MRSRIGKYHVLGRIGRGGMGMILKAHDPVLDRPVALKVISNDIDVTDELRARFYREAQACARLSHPNIVTVHDMGEDEGRLFIVMELLEGEELRLLFSPHKSVPLEDKLSIMSQVCDGLHYAHQKGIVHRDIKPGNIFVLPNGQVKIVDFGIAQIATESGMTRTGLIMGTLRYIAPEQVRGRADHRSDIFSVGTVFYEFFAARPAFPGDDPIELLDRLRTEEPPPLDEIDPTMPAELAGILARAMRKDPAQRYENLEEMRLEIDHLRRAIEEDAQRLRVRVRAQREELLGLQAALAERIGRPGDGEPMTPAVPDRARRAALQAAEREFAQLIEGAQSRLARAEAVEPAVQQGVALLQAGRFEEALTELEAVVADVPEHARASEALEQARVGAEAARRARHADELMRDARSALERGDGAACLEILERADHIPPPERLAPDIAALRQAAEARLAALEEARRSRQHAEAARLQMMEARRGAEEAAAAQFVAGAWADAEAKAGQAQAAFAREAYLDAALAADAATSAYHRAEEAAHETQRRQREAAQQAIGRMTEARAQAAGADQYAADQWSAAEAKAVEAESALSANDLARAIAFLGEATDLYFRAHQSAVAARESQRRRADELRELSIRARGEAETGNAAGYAATLWHQASARSIEAQSDFRREQYAKAIEAFDAAVALYRQAETEAQAARQRERADVERRRQGVAKARDAAAAAAAAIHAPAEWQQAESAASSGDEAFARETYLEAAVAFDAATAVYRRAEEAAHEIQRRQREAIQRAQGQMTEARAQAAGAEQYAADEWSAAEAKAVEAESALSANDLARALALVGEATDSFLRAHQVAVAARESQRQHADELRELSVRARREAETANAAGYAATLWHQASARSIEAQSDFRREQYAKAIEAFDAAVTLYRQAETEALAARQRERADVERRRQGVAKARDAAVAAAAATHAPAEWQQAENAASSGDDASAREAYAEACRVYDRCVALYRRAEAQARDALRALQTDVERARDASGAVRSAAAAAGAERYASEQWRAGESAAAEAGAASSRQDHQAARTLFSEARRHYSAAVQAAGAAMEAETRRVDGLVRDARRRLATGDIPGCLERVNEALARRPGYEPAERIRSEAADVVRRIEAERRADEARAQDARAEADAATVRIPFEEPTVQSSTLPDAHPSSTPDAQPVGSLPEAQPVSAPASAEIGQHEPPPQSPPSRAWTWRRLRTATVAVGAVAAAAVVAFYIKSPAPTSVAPAPAPSPPASSIRPPEPPPPEPEVSRPTAPPPSAARELAEDLRKRMITARDEAAQAGAEKLARPSFDAAADKGREAESAMGRQDMASAQQQYNEAIAAFGLAKTEATRAAALARREADVQSVASRAAEARRAAQVVDAPKLARGLWTTGEGAQRKAEDSLKQGAFDRAQSLFGDAEKSFRAAAKAASDSAAASERERLAALKAALADAEQSRRTADQARQAAEQANAPRLAQRTFAAAQQKQADGDTALNRQDSATAKSRFQEAQQSYRQATQEAERSAVLQRQQTEAEQARERMMTARRGAEQAAAPRFAPKVYASAQTKDADASAALGRSDFGAATRLFGEARAEYQAAVQEARRETEREQRLVDQARATTMARREDAQKAGAEKLAKEAFDAAQARQAQADDLVARQNLAAAPKAYQDAAERYNEAGRQAKLAQEREARKAEPPPPPPRAQPEKQEARKVEPPPPPRPAPDDEVRGVLAAYARAFETRDIALLQEVRPGLKPEEVKRLRESFEQSREYHVSLKVESLEVQGDQAVAKGRRQDTLVSKGGQSFRNESGFTYRLKRSGARWIIDAVN